MLRKEGLSSLGMFLPWVSHFPPLHPARLHIFNMRRAVFIAQSVCIGASSLV